MDVELTDADLDLAISALINLAADSDKTARDTPVVIVAEMCKQRAKQCRALVTKLEYFL